MPSDRWLIRPRNRLPLASSNTRLAGPVVSLVRAWGR
jgi:hypothetical protein